MKNSNTKFFIVETRIIEVLQGFEKTEHYEASNQAGEQPSWLQDLSRGAMALGNVKSFLAAFAGLTPAQAQGLDEADWIEMAMEASDPAVGIDERIGGVEMIAQGVKYRTNAGVYIVLVNWAAVPTAAEIEAA